MQSLDYRVKALKKLFELENLDGYLVSSRINIRYFTGFSEGSRLLVLKDDAEGLYVHKVNYEAAKEYVKGWELELVSMNEDSDRKVIDHIKHLGLKRLGFDLMNTAIYLKFKEALENVEIEPKNSLVWSLRKLKDEEELKLMKKAADLTCLGMKEACEIIKPGLKERELAAEIEYAMRKEGSDGVAFETIVASGMHSAFPHGGCGDREIVRGDIVVIDIGAKYQGYCADLTRTMVIGQMSLEQATIYETVMSAHEQAMKHVKANVKANAVDAAARELISEKGYGENFVHSLGHGVGLEVHEQPVLNPKNEEPLEAGNVVTIEPGIYISGFGGIRVEDTVVVKKNGIEKLTS